MVVEELSGRGEESKSASRRARAVRRRRAAAMSARSCDAELAKVDRSSWRQALSKRRSELYDFLLEAER